MFGALIPVCIFGKMYNLEVDIIKGNCPLLISKPTLVKLGVILDFSSDNLQINNRCYKLKTSDKGHYLLPLFNFSECIKNADINIVTNEAIIDENCNNHDENEIFISEDEYEVGDDECEVFNVNVVDEALKVPANTAKKLHLAFGHPSSERLINTIKAAMNDKDSDLVKSLISAIKDYTLSCEICLDNQKCIPRPKVTLPSAELFNDVLAIDITFWSDPTDKSKVHSILHMIDLATRFSSACFVKSKEPECTIQGFTRFWMCMFGPPKRVWFDNGGEFANDKLTELLERHGITVKSTAANAPYMNGICERHNAIIKETMTKVKYECKDLNVLQILGYALYAKNALIDRKGFSPFQRVFGNSPNIPHLMIENPNTLNANFRNDIVLKHLQMLNETRKA